MQVRQAQLTEAVEQGILAEAQAQQLWLFLKEQNKDLPSFQFTHVLYYFGGMIAIGAMSLFMNLGWESFGGFGLFFICVAYAVVGISLTELLLKQYQLAIPAGILATLVLVLVPLAVYGLQEGVGLWDGYMHYQDYHKFIDWRWFIMELATLAVGICMVYWYRLPFLLMPVAVTLWYMSMDLTPALLRLFGYLQVNHDVRYWELRQQVSLWFGLAMIVLAFVVDVKNRSAKDFSFWLYLGGVCAFWGALSSMSSDSELGKFLYCCINLLMILVGAALARRVFVIFGGFGVAGYLGYLSYSVFENSLLFPFALTLIGLMIIALGIYWQRHEQQINQGLQQFLPKGLKEFIATRNS